MAVVITFQCPDCAEKFKWPGDQAWPDFCPKCRSDLRKEVTEIAMPFIRSAQSKSVDKVYRDIEAGSETRAQMAADLLGVPVADVSDLKVTNLRDAKPGEIHAVPVNNEVSRFMDQHKVGGFGGQGVEYSPAVQSGPHANSGAKFRTQLQNYHASISHGSAVTDAPALETLQPGYRRRG